MPLYLQGLAGLSDGTLALASGLKCALLKSTYTFSDTHSVLSDVSSHEVSGAGYTAGGKDLTEGQSAAGSTVSVSLSPVSWASSTITDAAGALVYDGATGRLVAWLPFAAAASTVNGTLTVQFPTNLTLTKV
jgi:hypothetical protein